MAKGRITWRNGERVFEVTDPGTRSGGLKEIMESRHFPALRTDTEFLAKSQTNYRVMTQLEDYPGDPKARVTSRDDIRRICEKRGWGCHGTVNVRAREKPPQEDTGEYKIAPDIVDFHAKQFAREHKCPVSEARGEVVKELSPKPEPEHKVDNRLVDAVVSHVSKFTEAKQ